MPGEAAPSANEPSVALNTGTTTLTVMTLEGTTIAVGVTGSIAAVEGVKLIHELRRRGAEVHAVMTEAATGIVHPWSLQFATGNEVVTEITGDVEHVALVGELGSDFESFRNTDAKADLFLIAPSTANTVGKIANGIDDTTVTTFATTALGSGIPVLLAPAMHEPMYDHPGVVENLETIEEYGVTVIPPKIEEDKAKLADRQDIAMECERVLHEGPLSGDDVVVTSGRTEEAIDPVRVLTTRSSGKMGRAVAEEAYVRGADVDVVHNHDREVRYADEHQIESAQEMIEAAERAVEGGCDVFVSAAAISDYTVEEAEGKIASGQDLELPMEKVPKLVDRIREAVPEAYMVGFKAETDGDRDALVAAARETMDRARLDLVVANDADTMGSDDASVVFVGPSEGDEEDVTGSKRDVARAIWDRVEEDLEG